jgi:NAD(P)H-flavin reductase
MQPILYAAEDAESHNTGVTGFVLTITEKKITSADELIAMVCGRPVMIEFTQPVLEKVDFLIPSFPN